MQRTNISAENREKSVYACQSPVVKLANEEDHTSLFRLPKLTRRSFLKTTAVAAGTAAFSGGAATMLGGCSNIAASNTATDAKDQIFRGICRPNCFGFCHLNVHVRDGKIVKTSRADYNDPRYSRICHRGLVHPQRIYDPERIKHPLRRVKGTDRGAGQWEQITWDEALTAIADTIKQVRSTVGDNGVAWFPGSGMGQATGNNFYTRLMNLLKSTFVSQCLDMASYYGIQRLTGPSTQLWECNEQTDIINAKNIVVWGGNVTDAQVQSWHFIKEAMQNGTKLTVIDPTYTTIASKADLWIPIRPGTDMPLYMGLMNIFLQRDAVDFEFLNKNTVAPFLVKSSDGKFLRRSDTGVEATVTKDPATGADVTYDPYLVLENGVLTAYDVAKSPDAEATYSHNEDVCTTAYGLLKKEIAKFPVSVVSELTQIPEETIEALADICLDGPVTHYVGYGPQAYANGVHTTHAGMCMAALTGNLGKPGASYGSFWHVYFGTNSAFGAPAGPNTTPAIPQIAFIDAIRQGKYLNDDFNVKFLFVYGANPINTNCDPNAFINEVLPELDMMVVADPYMTDTAKYADIVLPVSMWFEYTDYTSQGQAIAINFSEKAIEPLYESKSDQDIVRGLAGALGLAEYFKMTDEEAMRELLTSDLGKALGVSYDNLVQKKELRFSFDNPHIAWSGGPLSNYSSASGRLEFYLETPAPRGNSVKKVTPDLIERERLPHWFPPQEAWHESEAMKKYPLHFMSERPRYRVHSQWFSVKALRELDPEPFVKINPIDAMSRNIADGSYVECYNDRGHGVGKAVYSDAIRPGTLVYAKGWQLYQHKAGSWSELLTTDYDVFGVNSNFMDVACEIRPWTEGSEA
ncbi:MAG: molybdopterin-dependent oxidoreductase [Coriobacteriales bacterium]|jgi:anaerobic selenocysteine-containing dehydrogenase|nr:molybdopterin-dependent oxidoreductase [Coriobacteriales bacterium]